MASNKYIFNLEDVVHRLAFKMEPYLEEGVEDYCNFLPVVEIMVEYYFYGSPISTFWHSVKSIEDYGVPKEEAEVIASEIRGHLFTLFISAMGTKTPNDAYIYDIDERGNLKVEIVKPPELSLEQKLLKEINDGLDNGDYYPETYRRLVGAG